MADPIEQAGDTPHPEGLARDAGGWELVVARAIHTAQVFGPEGVPAAGVGPSKGWELALGAHGAARLLSALWVEASAREVPVPAEVAAAIHALSEWSKERAAMP